MMVRSSAAVALVAVLVLAFVGHIIEAPVSRAANDISDRTLATPVFQGVYLSPRHPLGAFPETGMGGDVIAVYANVVDAKIEGDGVYIKYAFCQNSGICQSPSEWMMMDHISGNLYRYILPGDDLKGWPVYEASTISYVYFKLNAWSNDWESEAYYPASPIFSPEPMDSVKFYPAFPPTQINATSTLSKSTIYPGQILWVNGTSSYWNSTSKPKDYSKLLPADECNVVVAVGANNFYGKTDVLGGYSVQLTAPSNPGTYAVSVTISNSTVNRNKPTQTTNPTLIVTPVPEVTVAAVAAPQNLYPGKVVWVNGTATHSDSTPVSASTVTVTIVGAPGLWTTTTDASGTYSRSITNPSVPGTYSVKVDVTSAAYGTTGSDLTMLAVKQPVLKVSLLTNTTTILPSGGFWANGTVRWDNSDAASGATIAVTIPNTPLRNDTIASSSGSYSAFLHGPNIVGQFAVNISTIGAQYATFGYNESSMFVVAAPVPDLTIPSDGLGYSSEGGSLLEGRTMTIHADIWNLGIAPARNFTVDAYVDGNNAANYMLSLAVGCNDAVTLHWPAVKGNHSVLFVVDEDNLTEESFEDNNHASLSFYVDGDADGDGVGDIDDDDDDNDGYPDWMESELGTSPLDPYDSPQDIDDDGIPDVWDYDIDGDGVANEDDSFPLDPGEWADLDNDGVGDGTDPDIDGDGVANEGDAFPLDPYEWTDLDGDGIGDNTDPDIDDDGVPNADDAFPLDPYEWTDLDVDGIGDNSDDDIDGDGYSKDIDPYPFDTDNDGLPNQLDLDDDADGILDSQDPHPFDTDNDGLPNQLDFDDDGDGISDRREDLNWNGLVDAGETSYLLADTDSDGVTDGEDATPTGDVGKLESGRETTPGLLATLVLFIVVPVAVTALALRKGGH
jgi:hypothetical protein